MGNGLYELMNWPDIEGIVYSECDRPKSLLGARLLKEGLLIQVFRPDAVSVDISVEGKKKIYHCEKVDEAGYFAVLIPVRKMPEYEIIVEKLNGSKEKYKDAYSFDNTYEDDDFKAFLAGTEKNADEILGSHVIEKDGVTGTLFTVWAPNAIRVSVVGEFNNFDGRIHQMERIGNCGVFELFIPGVGQGSLYRYEVKWNGSMIGDRIDPYSYRIVNNNEAFSVVTDKDNFEWEDKEFIESRAKQKASRPFSVCEINLSEWMEKIAGDKDNAALEKLVRYVKQQGYTDVQFMPVAGCLNNTDNGYGTSAYYSVSPKIGSLYDYKRLVNEFHKEGIGVIIDWNGAYFGNDNTGLDYFDGTPLYGELRPSLELHPDIQVTTFAYEKGAVRSFLLSNIRMWIEDCHSDGIKIDSVASMIYLDYGKQPSTWKPNIYGGNENLEAIKFIKSLNAYVGQYEGVITIAEESSGYGGVTKENGAESLGFDYKWDKNWTNDTLTFFEKDPLFRKGVYGKLTYAMLYHYTEKYMLTLSHDEFRKSGKGILDMASGNDSGAKLSDVRSLYAYMYMHPGAKLLTMGQDVGLPYKSEEVKTVSEKESSLTKKMECFIKELNRFYKNNSALYDNDESDNGFEWLDNISADETVIAFLRRSSNGKELTVIANFTPVYRENFTIPVHRAGKYSEVFNTDKSIYGGENKVNSGYNNSEYAKDGKYDEYDSSLTVNLPPSSVVVFECQPYTDVEVEEIKIKDKAAIAKREAEEKAAKAKEYEELAANEAKLAQEAEKKAKEALKAAVKAREDAKKKADEAILASRRIDEETKKELEMLRRKNK